MIRVQVVTVADQPAGQVTVTQDAVRVLHAPTAAELGDAILNPTKTVVCPDEETAQLVRDRVLERDDLELLEPEPRPPRPDGLAADPDAPTTSPPPESGEPLPVPAEDLPE